MSAYKVTLKSELKHGTFYWVSTVTAASEEEAATAAEHLFLEQISKSNEWDFSDYDAEKL
ncbi:MAG: hypothetical protein HOJ34_04830 [Kordiimonadaceae bacterium]|jgi:hypothetical protein|nr:hypothetical protein [Kordiimonadaceae bacterium]MBT6036144.1 hypothetical protein [Kordiimonadaceae bacterium]MBT6329089.1 hypothetical protein [Kordiimonadaceae bacterium]MBT7583539.1 hypothetical protein [Kordiimonadaceae bacterium]